MINKNSKIGLSIIILLGFIISITNPILSYGQTQQVNVYDRFGNPVTVSPEHSRILSNAFATQNADDQLADDQLIAIINRLRSGGGITAQEAAIYFNFVGKFVTDPQSLPVRLRTYIYANLTPAVALSGLEYIELNHRSGVRPLSAADRVKIDEFKTSINSGTLKPKDLLDTKIEELAAREN